MPATSKRKSERPSPDGSPKQGALSGLGPASMAMLRAAGIRSNAHLARLGSARAYLQVQSAGLRPSLNLLWALEGALMGQPWQQVARLERTRLLLEIDDLQSASLQSSAKARAR
jgi:DNA transformation protein and related proteins